MPSSTPPTSLLDVSGAAGNTVYLNGEDVSQEIRTDAVTSAVSAVSAHPEVRRKLVDLQRAHARDAFLVVEGRDIGTVVFPNAALKIFLTATPEARAESIAICRMCRPDATVTSMRCWRA